MENYNTKYQAQKILKAFRKKKLNAFLIGSVALKGKGNDIDIILIDAPEDWSDIVEKCLLQIYKNKFRGFLTEKNDWGGDKITVGLRWDNNLIVDIFIKNPR